MNGLDIGHYLASTSMASSSMTTLLSCLLIHIQIINSNNWIGFTPEGNIPVILSVFQGTSFLLYPLSGWIAEVFFTNFRMIKWSFFAMLISSVALIVTCFFSDSKPKDDISVHNSKYCNSHCNWTDRVWYV